MSESNERENVAVFKRDGGKEGLYSVDLVPPFSTLSLVFMFRFGRLMYSGRPSI